MVMLWLPDFFLPWNFTKEFRKITMYGHLPIYYFVKLSQFIKSADSLIKLKELHCNELYVKALFVASHDALQFSVNNF